MNIIEKANMNIYQKSSIVLGVLVFIGSFIIAQTQNCSSDIYKTCEDTINMTLLPSV